MPSEFLLRNPSNRNRWFATAQHPDSLLSSIVFPSQPPNMVMTVAVTLSARISPRAVVSHATSRTTQPHAGEMRLSSSRRRVGVSGAFRTNELECIANIHFEKPAKTSVGHSVRRLCAMASEEEQTKPASRPSLTDMYLAVEEMERAAEEAEVECVGNAYTTSMAAECNAVFLDKSNDIELARLSAQAAGSGAEEEGTVARAAVKAARQKKRTVQEQAELAELECMTNGGSRNSGECIAVFLDEWERAEEDERQAVIRYRGLLRRWVNIHK